MEGKQEGFLEVENAFGEVRTLTWDEVYWVSGGAQSLALPKTDAIRWLNTFILQGAAAATLATQPTR